MVFLVTIPSFTEKAYGSRSGNNVYVIAIIFAGRRGGGGGARCPEVGYHK